MHNDDRSRAEAQLDALLKGAHAALDQADVKTGRELSHQALKAALALESKRFEAKALLCLAHCDRMLSRYRRAHRASQRAAQAFQLLGDTPGEVMALSTHAYVAVNLGRNEEAVEAALLSVRLSEFVENAEHSVLSYNALGVAYFWSRNFDKAEQALQTALQIAEQATPPLDTFQPRINQWWNQIIRIFHERFDEGPLPSLALMRVLRESVMQRHQHCLSTEPVSNVTTEAVLMFAASLDHCWHGQLELAKAAAAKLNSWAQGYGTLTWLAALDAWVRAEIAWADQNWPVAHEQAAKMIDISVTVEHEQLACLGHMLASQLFEAQGASARALDELRRLRQREQLIRSDCLESREHVINWQMDLRLRQRSIAQLERTSRQLEKLSLEDSLTGIPNRRSFERYADDLLKLGKERGQMPCLALIDVDQFKQINDRFSHQVGDEVLKRIAQILKAHVREEDMAARLGGDEFVIVFKTADLHIAQQVCQRIGDTVRQFDWSALSPGLQSSISVGVARAEQQDTVETLTHRSDTAMYLKKKTRSSASATLH
jgi:diguanylate cyclase (GGDEF)-like protein